MATSVKCARCVILSYISSSVTCRLWLASHGLRLDDYINESSDVSTALWPQLVSDGVRDVRALGLPPHHGTHSSVDPAHRRLGRRRLGDRPGRDTGHVSADASCQTVRGSISDADGDGEVASMRAAPTPLEAGLSRPGNASTYLTAVKSLLELMSAELGLVDLRSRLHLTDAHDLATCRCQQQDAPEVDVRPEPKETSKVLCQHSTIMFEYLHKLDWTGFRKYCQQLHMKCAGRNDADIKCLLAIYRTEEIRNHRLGRETVDSCNEIELMLPKTRCPEYLTIRLLSTKAAGYDLSNDSTSSIHCYHQAAQLAVLTKASMASAYSLIMYAIHGLLHRRIDHETMAIPNDNTWKEAEYYVAWGLEQHRRWISWLNEDPHISEETVRYFQSSTLLKYGFVLIRTCIQGDPPLLATVFPLDITQLRSAKCCLAEIICHFVEFSVRGTVAVNFLACDLCIRHSQRCLATNHDNAIVWLKQAFRHAHRAKFACGKMVDKQHADIGYRFTLKRLQFIEKTLVGLFAKCSSSFRCAEHSPDDEYLLTLPLLERTSLGTEQERYIGDDLLQLERGYKVTILPTPSEEQRIEPKRLYSPRTATLIGHKDSHEFQNPDDPLHSVSNGDLAQTRPKQPLDGDAHVFSSAIHLDSCREQESISPAHPAPSASLHHPTRTHPKQILDPDEHVFNLPITSEDLRAQVIRLSTDGEEQTLPKCPTGESAENDI